jgi:hypothetical protein
MIFRGWPAILTMGSFFLPVIAWSSSGGTSGGTILNIPVGARAIAMGEAYTAQADDISSLYWNPAGLAFMNQSQASFMFNPYVSDLTYQNASTGVSLENGGIGASISYLSYGHIQGYDTVGEPSGEIKAYSSVGSLGGGFLGNNWSAGANVKGVRESLADVTATGFAADLGAMIVYPKEVKGGTLRAGFAIRNIGNGLKYIDQTDPFPRQWRIGAAALQMMNNKLNISLDYGQERDAAGAAYGGFEYWALPYIALRAGYAGSDLEGNGLRAGLGLRIKDISFDYAFSQYGDLGVSHRYEFSMKFGGVRATLTPEMRRMYKQAKLAMAQGRYGEATLLLDSLISMAPTYHPFRKLSQVAMARYERQEQMAKKSGNVDLTALGIRKSGVEDKHETDELESLLNLSDPAAVAQGNTQLNSKGGGNMR